MAGEGSSATQVDREAARGRPSAGDPAALPALGAGAAEGGGEGRRVVGKRHLLLGRGHRRAPAGRRPPNRCVGVEEGRAQPEPAGEAAAVDHRSPALPSRATLHGPPGRAGLGDAHAGDAAGVAEAGAEVGEGDVGGPRQRVGGVVADVREVRVVAAAAAEALGGRGRDPAGVGRVHAWRPAPRRRSGPCRRWRRRPRSVRPPRGWRRRRPGSGRSRTPPRRRPSPAARRCGRRRPGPPGRRPATSTAPRPCPSGRSRRRAG